MSDINSIYNFNSDSTSADTTELQRLRAICVRCYQRVLGQLGAVKVKIDQEFGWAMAGYEQLLKTAVNEAEALAWQTPYPHLLFPTLA